MAYILEIDMQVSPLYFQCTIFFLQRIQNELKINAVLRAIREFWRFDFSSQRPSGITQTDGPAVLRG
jgi:hypothetical protein